MTEPAEGHITVTAPFRITAADYFSALLMEWLPRYGWIILMPVLATAMLGIVWHDERWLLVALILVFIVAPMIMSFIYPAYMLTPVVCRAVLWRRLTIVQGRYILIEYVDPRKSSENEEDGDDGDDPSSPHVTLPDEYEDEVYLPPAEMIDWDDILCMRRSPRFIIYQIRSKRIRLLLIPRGMLLK